MAGNYAKRPWWFWLLVYVVVGGLVYLAIYYFGYAKQGSSPYQNPGGTQEQPY